MNNVILSAIIATGVIGFLAAAVLVIASKLMYVRVDPKIGQLRAVLPGANCGACGYSGCDGYAQALAAGGATADLCPPGGEDAYKQISMILGESGGDGPVKKTAAVCCAGGLSSKTDKMRYEGISTCLAAGHLYGGANACTSGCLGYGDCRAVCKSGAICIADGIARIDMRKCTGCGLCVKACPGNVIAMMTQPLSVAVLCMNTEKGAVVRNKCKKGCIACTKCVRECPAKAIEMKDNLAVIDYEKCDGCGHCGEVCMTQCIALYKTL